MNPEVETRLQALERNSHPPMPYVVCPTCASLVREGDQITHEIWHNTIYALATDTEMPE